MRTAPKKSSAGHGRERNGHLQLWIILTARALPRVRPAMVEHIFALAVRLEVGGGGRNEMRDLILDEDRSRSPSGARPDAVRIFERGQEGMADEGITAAEPVPGTSVQARYARGN